MAAAVAAAEHGHEVHIYEKNEKLGKKLYITGKGRCNVTNACGMEKMLEHVVSNPRFLYSSFYGFTNQDIMDLLERNGCPLKVERGERVFPVSDKSFDVISALYRQIKKQKVEVHLFTEVRGLEVRGGRCVGLCLAAKKRQGAETAAYGDAVIVATGGLSYQSTGSTGDGYRFARECGHTVTELLPALVPLPVKEEEVRELEGLSLRNIEAVVSDGEKELYRGFGEMLFTHDGVSGPVILSASSYAAGSLKENALTLSVDLKPALTQEQLDARILRDFEEFSNKQFKNALIHLYPSRLIPVMIKRSGICPEKKVNEVTKQERRHLVELTKDLRFTLAGPGSFKEAVITQGGVSVREVNPSTMESKRVPGLYFAGEVLDVDAVTGGFNLQIAWSTGWAAGSHAGSIRQEEQKQETKEFAE